MADEDDNNGKDKSVIDKLMDVVTTGVREVARLLRQAAR